MLGVCEEEQRSVSDTDPSRQGAATGTTEGTRPF